MRKFKFIILVGTMLLTTTYAYAQNTQDQCAQFTDKEQQTCNYVMGDIDSIGLSTFKKNFIQENEYIPQMSIQPAPAPAPTPDTITPQPKVKAPTYKHFRSIFQ